jgi:hypothetical protein
MAALAVCSARWGVGVLCSEDSVQDPKNRNPEHRGRRGKDQEGAPKRPLIQNLVSSLHCARSPTMEPDI